MANTKPSGVPIAHRQPRFAPRGYIPLLNAIDLVGKKRDPAWTGEERMSPAMPQRTPKDLDREAADIFDREIADNSILARSEDAIRAAIQEKYDRDRAPRRRRQAAVAWLREMLIDKVLDAIAFSATAKELRVPAHVWRADRAEEVFDIGLVRVSNDQISFVIGLDRPEDTALVMIREKDIEDALAEQVTVRSTAAAETRCRRWLFDLMSGGSQPDRPKSSYRIEAKTNFTGLGDRAFQRAWDSAIADTGNGNWKRPGPRPKKSSEKNV